MKKIILALLLFCTTGAFATISPTAKKHIIDRHWYNAKQGAKTSHFNRSMNTKKLDSMAQKTIKQGSKRPSIHDHGRSTHQYRFNKPIGKTTQGSKAYSLRVVTNKNGDVITAFPVK